MHRQALKEKKNLKETIHLTIAKRQTLRKQNTQPTEVFSFHRIIAHTNATRVSPGSIVPSLMWV